MAPHSTAPGRKRPTGRRAGDSGSRDDILDAARDQFAEHGFDGASMRAIAAQARVDPGLIRHYFSDKEGLFAATVADRSMIPERIAAAFRGDPATIGRRVTENYLSLWEDPETQPILVALARSASTSTRAAEMLAEVIGSRIAVPGDPDVAIAPNTTQLAMAAAQLFGIAFGRHVLRLPLVTQLSHEDLVDAVAPTIQGYLSREAR